MTMPRNTTSIATPVLRQRMPRWAQTLGPLLVTLGLLCVWLILALRSLQFFCYEDDEGTFLLAAQSMLQGHALYREIWYNYLPGLMGLVMAAFRLGGMTVEAARTMIVLFGALTLLVTASVAAGTGRRWAAPLAAGLLLFTPSFVRMGRSVMGEVPAGALSVAAVLVALQYHRVRKPGWLALAGLLGGLATSVKYPTAIILPIVGLDAFILLVRERVPFRRAAKHLLLFVGAAIAIIGLPMLCFDSRSAWQQTVGIYRDSVDYFELRVGKNLYSLVTFLVQNNFGLLPLACLGLGRLVAERRPGAWLLGSWPAVTIVAMLLSSPLTAHHLYLLLAPLAALSAVALAELPHLLRGLWRRPWRLRHALLGAVGALCLFTLVGFAPETLDSTFDRLKPKPKDKGDERKAVALVVAHTQEGDRVVCDYPMIAFRTGRGSPPSLINLSALRLRLDPLSSETVAAITQDDPPAAVVFWSNRLTERAPDFASWVQREYVPVWANDVTESDGEVKTRAVYLRRDRATVP